MPRSSRRERISPGSIAVARSSVLEAGTCQNDGRLRRWRRRVASSARYQLCIEIEPSTSVKRAAMRGPATSFSVSSRANWHSTTCASASMTGWPSFSLAGCMPTTLTTRRRAGQMKALHCPHGQASLDSRVRASLDGGMADRVSSAAVTAQCREIFRAWGMTTEHARVTAERLEYADLHGVDSHGIALLPLYARLRAENRINFRPEPRLLRDTPVIALIDADGGLGQIAGTRATLLAIEKARAVGLAAVAVRNSNHFGAAGAYAMLGA